MILDRKFSPKRLTFILLMLLVTIAMSFGMVFLCGGDIFDHIFVLIYSILIFAILILWLEFERIKRGFTDEKFNNFGRIFVFYLLSAIFISLFAYLGVRFVVLDFFSSFISVLPIALVAMSFAFILSPIAGSLFGTYFVIVFFSLYTLDYKFLVLQIAMCMVASYTADMFKNKESRIPAAIIVFASDILLEVGTIFVVNQRIGIMDAFACLLSAAILVTAGLTFGKLAPEIIDNVYSNKIYKLTNACPDELKQLSLRHAAIYDYSCKISSMAFEAAKIIGVDADLARMGGLYCRIGVLESDDLEKGNYLVAVDMDMPNNLIQLIVEASRMKGVPTTKEAAIVILACRCLKAIEQMREDASKNGWNKEIISNQIFNNASVDETFQYCGLTIKEFIDIKNCYMAYIKNMEM